jgi:hypothetical protein
LGNVAGRKVENLQFNFVGPLAPIIGAIVGALIAAIVTYSLVVKRKSVVFWIRDTEDLTSSLRKHHHAILFKIGEIETANLNRATVSVSNVGNVSVPNLKYEIVVPGTHQVALAEAGTENFQLRQEIVITGTNRNADPAFTVSVTFLNPKESFDVEIFFDGRMTNCEVYCRMEELKVKVRKGGSVIDEAVEFGGGPEAMMGALIVASLRRLVGIKR